MTKNPFINAIAASVYITFVASVMNFFSKAVPGPDKPSIIIPVAVVSMFTLSAAVMGYLFVLAPIQMYLDGKKKQAVTLFLQTVGVFAGLTAIAFILLLTGVLR